MSQALDKFLQGMSAAEHLLNRAIQRQSALECIVLQANLIDGCLRVALILKAQLDSRSNAIDNSLLQQQDSDPKMPEKAIYNRCLEEAVIDKALFDELSAAYNKRNKCIHRYLLSDIDYDYATELVFELDGVHATWVSYDRGAAVPRSPDIDEWLSLAYSQKSASFAAEREYRIVIISLLSYKRPLADPIAPSIIFVRLKRRLSYCDLLPNYPQR